MRAPDEPNLMYYLVQVPWLLSPVVAANLLMFVSERMPRCGECIVMINNSPGSLLRMGNTLHLRCVVI
jgi:hypothetical protein